MIWSVQKTENQAQDHLHLEGFLNSWKPQLGNSFKEDWNGMTSYGNPQQLTTYRVIESRPILPHVCCSWTHSAGLKITKVSWKWWGSSQLRIDEDTPQSSGSQSAQSQNIVMLTATPLIFLTGTVTHPHQSGQVMLSGTLSVCVCPFAYLFIHLSACVCGCVYLSLCHSLCLHEQLFCESLQPRTWFWAYQKKSTSLIVKIIR